MQKLQGIKSFLQKAAEKAGKTYDDDKANELLKKYNYDYDRVVSDVGKSSGIAEEQIPDFQKHIYNKYQIKPLDEMGRAEMSFVGTKREFAPETSGYDKYSMLEEDMNVASSLMQNLEKQGEEVEVPITETGRGMVYMGMPSGGGTTTKKEMKYSPEIKSRMAKLREKMSEIDTQMAEQARINTETYEYPSRQAENAAKEFTKYGAQLNNAREQLIINSKKAATTFYGGPGLQYTMEDPELRKKVDDLADIKNMYDKIGRILAAPQGERAVDELEGLYYGLVKSNTAKDFFTFGINEMATNLNVKSAFDNYKEAEANLIKEGVSEEEASKKAMGMLPNEEKALLETFQLLLNAQAGSRANFMANVGEGLQDMLPFIAEFAATGGTSAVAKKAVTKWLTRFVKNQTVAKIGGGIAKVGLQAAIMPSMTKGAVERVTPQLDTTGKLVEGASAWEAVGKSYLSMMAEVLGEDVGSLSQAFTRKKALKLLASDPSKAQAFLAKTAAFLSSETGIPTIQGVPFEVLGEEITGTLQAAIDNDGSFFTPEGQAQLIIMCMLASGGGAIFSAPQRLAVKKNFVKAEEMLNDIPDADYTQAVVNATQNYTEPEDLFKNFDEISKTYKVSKEDYTKARAYVSNAIRYNQMSLTRSMQIEKGLKQFKDNDGNYTITTIEGKRWHIRNTEDLGKERKAIFAMDDEGNVKPFSSALIKTWQTKTLDEIENDVSMEQDAQERFQEEQDALMEDAANRGVEINRTVETPQGKGTVISINPDNTVTVQDEKGAQINVNIQEVEPYKTNEQKEAEKEEKEKQKKQDETLKAGVEEGAEIVSDESEDIPNGKLRVIDFDNGQSKVITPEGEQILNTPEERDNAIANVMKPMIESEEVPAEENIDNMEPEARFNKLLDEDEDIATEILTEDIADIRNQAKELRGKEAASRSERADNLRKAKEMEAEADRLQSVLESPRPPKPQAYDTENVPGLPGSVTQGPTIERPESVKGEGTEKAPTSGVLQAPEVTAPVEEAPAAAIPVAEAPVAKPTEEAPHLHVSDKAKEDLKGKQNAMNALVQISNELKQKANIINSEEMPSEVKEEEMFRLGEESEAVAFFHNGEIYILSNRIKSVSDAKKSYIHELVVHKGLRDFFEQGGQEVMGKQYAKFNDLMVDVFGSMSNTEILDIAKKYYPAVYNQYFDESGKQIKDPSNRMKAYIAEEFMAHLSEMETIPSRYQEFFDRLVHLIRKTFGLTSKQFTQSDLLNIIKDQRMRMASETIASKGIAQLYKERLSTLKRTQPETYWSVDLPSDAAIESAERDGRIVDVNGGMGIVEEDGNMIGLFKYDPAAKGTAKSVQEERVRLGGIKTDNFDGYLTKIYEDNGFRVVSRMDFNPEYAPEDMPADQKAQAPDVVFMIYDPNNEMNIEEKRFDMNDYDGAVNYRDSFLSNTDEVRFRAESAEGMKNDAQKTQEFFNDVVSGKADKYKPIKPWVPILPFTEQQNQFNKFYDRFKGNFDEHIATSIPAFRETQIKVGNAIREMYKDGGMIYDLGGSEGGFVKAITESSNGKIKSINLDPSGGMQEAHEAMPIPGSDFVREAFYEGFEDEGEVYATHRPKEKADVVHESMMFQFVTPQRGQYINEIVNRYLKDDGIFITEEKFKLTDKAQQKINEDKKNKDYKSRFYSKEQLTAKQEQVLVGMHKDQANYDAYKDDLRKNFKYVSEYWDSGNFKGLIASNNQDRINEFFDNVGDTSTEFSESNLRLERADKETRFKAVALEEGASVDVADPGKLDKPISLSLIDKVVVNDEGHNLSFVTKDDLFDIRALMDDIYKTGKNIWFWQADQLGRGLYSDNEVGTEHYLDAGPSYALDPANREKGAIWATGKKRKQLNELIESTDYIFIISGSPDKNKLFNKKIVDIFADRVGDFNKFKKDVLKVSKIGDINNFLNSVNSWDEFRESPKRKNFFIDILKQKAKKRSELKNYLEKKNAFIDVESLRDGFYKDNDFKMNDIMLVLKPTGVGDKPSSHSTYELDVMGEVIGVPDVKVDAFDIMPEEMKEKHKHLEALKESIRKSRQSQVIAPYGIGVRKISPIQELLIETGREEGPETTKQEEFEMPTRFRAAVAGARPTELAVAQKEWLTKETDSKYFKKWFGNSKAVDENGKPIVLYHGTSSDFNEFSGDNAYYAGFYFTADSNIANMYSEFADPTRTEGANIVPVYLSLQNPKTIDYKGENWTSLNDDVHTAMNEGYDGLIAKNVSDAGPVSDQYIAFNPNQIKSAIGNTGEFNPDNNDVRFRILGEKGAIALDNVDEATTRFDNLAVARNMENANKTPEDIKLATGWERGADTKWRYEVEDSINPKYGDNLSASITYAMKQNNGNPKLSDVVDDKALFDAYPEFADINIKFSQISGYGGYSRTTNTIHINKQLQFMDYPKYHKLVKEIVLHELQHAIQKNEGFARGGSVKSLQDEYYKLMGQVQKYNKQLDKATGKKNRDKYNQLLSEKSALVQKVIEFKGESGVIGYEIYEQIAGEVEARNVETRMNMTPEQRRQTLLSATEDVDRDSQRFMEEGIFSSAKHMRDVPARFRAATAGVPEADIIDAQKEWNEKGINSKYFKDWFKNSKVIDQDGNPLKVFHGTNYDFNTFMLNERVGSGDRFPYLGDGFYFTNLEDIAESYATDDENGRLIEAYISLQNPFITTNPMHTLPLGQGSFAKELGLNPLDPDQVQQHLKDLGHDGVIAIDEDEGYMEVVAFDSNQIKSATDAMGTFRSEEADIRFKAVEQTGTPEFKKWFGDSKAVDEKGNPLVVYHGTKEEFTVFDPKKQTNTAYGYGFYFATKEDVAKGYTDKSGRIFNSYIKAEKPLDSNAGPFSVNDLKKIIDEMVNIEINNYSDEISSYKDSFLSNVADTYSVSKKSAIQELANIIYNGNDNAVDQISELSNIIGDKQTAQSAVNKILGYDSVIVKDFQETGSDVYVAWFPNQIKSATENIGTFSPESPDIRFKAEERKPVKQIETTQFKSWFGESKVVDENNKPLVVYHGSPLGDITEFAINPADKVESSGLREEGMFFTTNKALAVKYMKEKALTPEFKDEINTEIYRLKKIQEGIRDNKGYNEIEARIKKLEDTLKGKVYEAYLKIDDMQEFDAKGKDGYDGWDQLVVDAGYKVARGKEAIDVLSGKNTAAYGYRPVDGIKASNIIDIHAFGDVSNPEVAKLKGDVYVVFNPAQIKSATENLGTFNPESPDIRFMVRTKPDPEKTIKAYKLFRTNKKQPGKLFPLFVSANEEVTTGQWLDAEAGELTPQGKVKSKLGPLAYRPGWHMGDLPIATHIGEGGQPPKFRPDNQVWAEVEVAADVDWQEEANKRASKTKKGDIIPRTAQITDQLPEDGFYRYKTNPNMTGNWIIGGSIKVNRILTDDEVNTINMNAGVEDLPRKKPLDLKEKGFEVAEPAKGVAAITRLKVDKAAKEADVNPTEAQKKAGNYKMGHVKIDDFDIAIENPKGSVRKGKDDDGKEWQRELPADYGYFNKTKGKDKDHIDVFIGPKPDSDKVYIIDQINPKTGEFDEHKVMFGFDNISQAKNTYSDAYEEGWEGLGNITRTTKDGLREWFKKGDTQKPYAEDEIRFKAEAKDDFKDTVVKKMQSFKESPYLLDFVETMLPKEHFNRYKDLYELGARLGISIDPNAQIQYGMAASFQGNHINFNPYISKYAESGWDSFQETLNHEIIHGVIRHGIMNSYAFYSDIKDVTKAVFDNYANASDEVKYLIDYIKSDKDVHENYRGETEKDRKKRIKGHEELITYAFTDRAFAEYLDSIPASVDIPAPGDTIFTQLKNIIRALINSVTKKPTALDQLNSALDKYVDTAFREKDMQERNARYNWGMRFEASPEMRFRITSKDPKMQQLFDAFYSLKDAGKLAEKVSLLEQEKTDANLEERRQIVDKIKAIKEGGKLGAKDVKDQMEILHTMIANYAKANMPMGDAGKRDIGTLLTAMKNARTPEAVEKAFEKIDSITGKVNAKAERGKNIRGIKRITKWMTGFKKQGQAKVGKFVYEDVKEFQDFGKMDKKAKDLARIVRSNKTSEDQKIEANAALDAMWNEINDKENKTVLDNVKMKLIELRRHGAKASDALVQSIHEDLAEIYAKAKDAKTDEDIQRALSRESDRDFIKEQIKGTPIEDKNIFGRMMTRLGNFTANAMGNWESLMTVLGGNKARDEFSLILNQMNQEIGINDTFSSVLDEALRDYSSAPDSKIKSKNDLLKYVQEMKRKNDEYLLNKPIRKGERGEGKPMKLSKMDILDIYNSIKNDDVRRDMYMSYGDIILKEDGSRDVDAQMAIGKERIDGLIGHLSESDKKFGDVMQKAVDSYYNRINEVFIKVYNRDLPKVENYWPSTAERATDVDVMQTFFQDAKHPSFTKERVAHRTPTPSDAFDKFTKHVKQGEWYSNMALPLDRLNKIFKDLNVKDLIIDNRGEGFYNTLAKHLQEQGLQPQTKDLTDFERIGGNLLGGWVSAKIGLTPSVPLKQLTSAINYMENMPPHEWAIGFMKGLSNPRKTFKEMWDNIPYLQTRFEKGYSEALEYAMNAASGLPKARNWQQAIKNFETMGTRGGDIMAIIFGGKPYVDYLIEKKGMSKEEAYDQFLLDTLRSQQAPFKSTLSLYQNSKNPFAKALFTFANTPSQYMRKMYEANAAYRHGDISASQLAKVYSIYAVANQFLYIGMGALVSAMMKGTDPGEDLWENTIKQIAVSTVGGLPIIRDLVDQTARELLGLRVYDDALPVVEELKKTTSSIIKAADGDTKEMKKAAISVLELGGISASNAIKLYDATLNRQETVGATRARATSGKLSELYKKKAEILKEGKGMSGSYIQSLKSLPEYKEAEAAGNLRSEYASAKSKAADLEGKGQIMKAERLKEAILQSKLNMNVTDFSQTEIEAETKNFKRTVSLIMR